MAESNTKSTNKSGISHQRKPIPVSNKKINSLPLNPDITDLSILQQFIQQVKVLPSLSLEDEQNCTTQIHRYQIQKKKLEQHAKNNTHLSTENAKKLSKINQYLQQYTNQLVLGHLRLVISITKQYQNLGLPFMDLVDEGIIGLLQAIRKFNPQKECRFSTYATWWIKQAITKALANKSRLIRIPVYLQNEIRQWLKLEQEEKENGNDPNENQALKPDLKKNSSKSHNSDSKQALSDSDLRDVEHIEIIENKKSIKKTKRNTVKPQKNLHQSTSQNAVQSSTQDTPEKNLQHPFPDYQNYINIQSLDGFTNQRNFENIQSKIPILEEKALSFCPYELAKRMDMETLLHKALNRLDTRKRLILLLRYGLTDYGSLTLEETGNVLGLTRERVRQLQSQALNALRNFEEGEALKDFIEGES